MSSMEDVSAKLDMSLDSIISSHSSTRSSNGRTSGGRSYPSSRRGAPSSSSSGGGNNNGGGGGGRPRALHAQRQRAAPYARQRIQNNAFNQQNTLTHTVEQLASIAGTLGYTLTPAAALPLSLPLASSSAAPVLTGTGGRVLKVSSQSNPKNVAGSIAQVTRTGETPTVIATGASAVNQCVKAIAIARGYLADDDIDLMVKTEFRNENRDSVTFLLTKTKPIQHDPSSLSELRVAQSSAPSSLAGSIAARVRDAQRIALVSIGAASVDTAVHALCVARRYVTQDKLDVAFRPAFIHVGDDDGNEQRSAVQFIVLAQQI